MEYNKLVRDKIPLIIRRNGRKPKVHTATDKEYGNKLKEKLLEEAREFVETGDKLELADVLEVVYSLSGLNRLSKKQLEAIRKDKCRQKGSFKKRVILDKVE